MKVDFMVSNDYNGGQVKSPEGGFLKARWLDATNCAYYITKIGDEVMSEEMLIKHCSPTLAGIKTGNMFVCQYDSEKDMLDTIRAWNNILSHKGIRVLPFRYRAGKALVYIYRPSRLKSDLTDKTAWEILHSCGYATDTPERCIVQLIQRLANQDEFPHEIGLFLGYPPEDVGGFIENKACNCKCCGCWKVYGDAESAQKTFAKYKKCTEDYCAHYARGKSVERLTVAG